MKNELSNVFNVNSESIVFTHNDFNRISFDGFTKKEIDFLYGVIVSLYNKEDELLTFPLDEVFDKLGFSGIEKTKRKLSPWANKFSERASKLVCPMMLIDPESTETFAYIPFFGAVLFNFMENEISFKINSSIQYMIQKYNKKYTAFVYGDLTGLNKKYSKLLFRLLSQWARNGECTYELNEFKRLMDMPKSLDKTSKIKQVAIMPAITELETMFPGLTYIPILEKQKLVKCKFVWDKQKILEKQMSEIREKRKPKSRTKNEEKNDLEVNSVNTKFKKGAYEKNFKNGYIPGDDSPVNGFNKWLQEIGIFKYYNEYFTNRFLAKSAITTLYKKFVIDATYSDMMFLSAMLEVIHNDHAMNEWNLEEDFSVVRKGKSKVKIYDSIFESLPLDKSNELKSFYSR